MIVNKVWDGTRFINTDSDTVDGFHATSVTALYKNVFMSGHDGFQFTATADVNSFAIPANIYSPASDTAEFYFEGLRLNAVEHFSLSGNTVALTFTLNKGESIFIEINHSSYNYEDLANKPSIGKLSELRTTSKTTLVAAINEVYDLAKTCNGNNNNLSSAIFTETYHRFTATNETSSVVIEDDLLGKRLLVYQLGIRLFEGHEYQIVNGKIQLAMPLKSGEYIDYVVVASSAEAFPTEVRVEYNVISEANTFNIVDEAVDKNLEMYLSGARLFKGYDYTVVGNTVTLGRTLKSEDVICYTYLK